MIQIPVDFLGFSSNKQWAFSRSSNFKASRFCSLLWKNTNFFLRDSNRNRTQFDSKSKQREEPEDCQCGTNRIFFWRSHEVGRKRRASRSWSSSSTWSNWNCYHFHSKLCDNGFESEKRKIWENETEIGIQGLKKGLDFLPILFLNMWPFGLHVYVFFSTFSSSSFFPARYGWLCQLWTVYMYTIHGPTNYTF